MALFDGGGSFGLGLGGFDVSDFMGLTGDGGLGSMVFDNGSMNTSTLDAAKNTFGNDLFNPSGVNGSALTNNIDVGNYKFTDGGLANLNGVTGSGEKGGSWMDSLTGGKNGGSILDTGMKAWGLYEASKQNDINNKYREDVFNNQVKAQNDSLAGKKNLINAYYGNTTNDGSDNALLQTEDYKTI